MTITKHPVNGSYVISSIVRGHLVTRVYYGYTRRDCASMFRRETRKTK